MADVVAELDAELAAELDSELKSELDYDVGIIGAGQAGVPLARLLAHTGRRVVLFEREQVGGSCVNFGCTPTKAALASARLAHQIRRASEFGLNVPAPEVDFPAVLKRARGIVEASRGSLTEAVAEDGALEFLRTHARLEGADGDGFRIRAGGVTLTARHVVLDTGSRTALPPVEGLGEVDFLGPENWLHRPELPVHLVVLGAGPIGLEMAQFYRRMGSDVTVVETADRALSAEDDDVSRALVRRLEDEGIAFLFGTQVTRISRETGERLAVGIDDDGSGSEEIVASHVFVATGRRPNTDDLGLDSVGVELDDRGFVVTDPLLRTSVPGIWATGDMTGDPMFTHRSWDDHRVVASQFEGDGSHTTERLMPYAVFTDPELGRVGITEAEARRRGRKYRVARLDMRKNGKAREIGETDGFVKVLVDPADRTILGAAVLSHDGSELIHEYLDVMAAGAPFSVILDTVHIHPTLSEALHSVFRSWSDM